MSEANPIDRVVMRRELVQRAKKQRDEILQLFADAAHWNESHTRFEHIDPDPAGELERMLIGLEVCIENEGAYSGY